MSWHDLELLDKAEYLPITGDAFRQRVRFDLETDFIRLILPANQRSLLIDPAAIIRHQVRAGDALGLPERRDVGSHTARAPHWLHVIWQEPRADDLTLTSIADMFCDYDWTEYTKKRVAERQLT